MILFDVDMLRSYIYIYPVRQVRYLGRRYRRPYINHVTQTVQVNGSFMSTLDTLSGLLLVD